MNFFELNTSGSSTLHPDRAKFRAKRMPLMPQYCLFDFNLSTVFPRKASLNICRLPHDLSWCGTPRYHPPDLKQGELDYNPFMFDVGCMGYMLLHNTHVRIYRLNYILSSNTDDIRTVGFTNSTSSSVSFEVHDSRRC